MQSRGGLGAAEFCQSIMSTCWCLGLSFMAEPEPWRRLLATNSDRVISCATSWEHRNLRPFVE